jgi:hypothetical protein
MRNVLIFTLVASVSAVASAQTKTTTNCSTNGNQTSCTSNSYDYGAQQQQMYQAGQQIGTGLGLLLGAGIRATGEKHQLHAAIKKYCTQHDPGTPYAFTNERTAVTVSGTCKASK